MVRAAPNWSHVRGVVLDVADVGDPSGYVGVSLRLADVAAVPGERSILRSVPGEQLQVLIATDVVERLGVRPGVELEADVRRADLTRTFVHPDRVRVQPADPGIVADEVPSPDADDDEQEPS
jgi:hypothetical protein